MKRLLTRSALLGLGAVTFSATYCAVYDDTLLLPSPDASGGATGGRGGSTGGGGSSGKTEGGGAGGAPICEHATFPGPPTETDAGGEESFVVAMSEIDFGETYDPDSGTAVPERNIGYDLDNKCSGRQGEGESCAKPPWANGNSEDYPAGRDNALGRLITEISSRFVSTFGSAAYTQQINEGKVSILYKVDNWNGQPNDDQVTTALMMPAPLNALGGRDVPLWDGTDTWPVASDSVNGTPLNPKFADDTAYVRDGTLVAKLTTAQFRISVGLAATVVVELNIRFSGAFLTAKLVKGPHGWEMHEGQIAARWPVQELLAQLSQFPDVNDASLKTPLCINNSSYPNFKNAICKFVDISFLNSPECDALSVGIGFTALPAKLGNVWELRELKSRCTNPTTDPANDACGRAIPFPDSGSGGAGGSATDASSD